MGKKKGFIEVEITNVKKYRIEILNIKPEDAIYEFIEGTIKHWIRETYPINKPMITYMRLGQKVDEYTMYGVSFKVHKIEEKERDLLDEYPE